ncbi:hypothetical protein [Neisseria leonii]|uniref:hypothetical protein n=1 Tax=Neisseria leonii TaxID=2995413 RepID=UPI00237A7042|nr:hypothetical protein [Neisseria sp. 3986]MDD9325728.1 hypothetical protein [Neisseria sp. 3986]
MLNIKLFLLRTYYFYFIFALVCTLMLVFLPPLFLPELFVSKFVSNLVSYVSISLEKHKAVYDFFGIKSVRDFFRAFEIILFALNLLAIFISFGLYNFRVRRSNQLIYKRGVLGKGKITKILKGLSSEDTASYQFHYVILQADGKPYHSFFRVVEGYTLDTQRGNLTYPTRQFVRYPNVGEEFEVKYIPANPKYFVILNTGDSEFARHIRVEYQREFIQQLESRISRTKYLLDADPHNPERQKIYQQAQQDLNNYQQFGTEPMLTESPTGEIVFKLNP